jgi:hypothetical protein
MRAAVVAEKLNISRHTGEVIAQAPQAVHHTDLYVHILFISTDRLKSNLLTSPDTQPLYLETCNWPAAAMFVTHQTLQQARCPLLLGIMHQLSHVSPEMHKLSDEHIFAPLLRE